LGQGGITDETVAQEVVDMGDMVQRDRSHPSVMICASRACLGKSSVTIYSSFSVPRMSWQIIIRFLIIETAQSTVGFC
jgi:hypothetical protein